MWAFVVTKTTEKTKEMLKDDDQAESDSGKQGQQEGEKKEEFQSTSFIFFSLDNPVRKAAIKLVTWKWFERISILIIVINSLTLSLVDPCENECEKTFCFCLHLAEIVIFSFFTIEMLVKMFAMGVFGKHSYWNDKGNRLDCFIVLLGYFLFCFLNFVSFKIQNQLCRICDCRF